MEVKALGRHERVPDLGRSGAVADVGQEEVEPSANFNEFRSALCPVWPKSPLPQSVRVEIELQVIVTLITA